MVNSGTFSSPGVVSERSPFEAPAKGTNYMRLGMIAAASVAICGAALLAMPQENVAVELLKGDAESVAGKVLKSQHFHKANAEEQETFVKHSLKSTSAEGKALIAKIASVAADKHESYHDRMAAMKKLLDSETDNLKAKPLVKPTVNVQPKHAGVKAAHRGRVQKAEDDAKAIADGEKLIHETQSKVSGGHKLEMSAKDKAIKAESEKSSADPKTMDKWMKEQAKSTAQKKHALKKAADAKIASNKAAKDAAAAQSADPPAAGTSYEKLVEWAEAHGLPKKLADNPADKQKVHDIIARMKADAEVAKIKAQFKHDDAVVGGVVHGADPGAAGII